MPLLVSINTFVLGKSPSAAELVAPYPSFATGGTDDDLESSLDKKSKVEKLW